MGNETSNYDAVVIGMGIAGLTTEAMLAKNGMKVLGIERRKKVGGLLSSFDRKGVPFINLSASGILGCAEGGFVRELLKYLNVENDVEFVPLDPTGRYFFPGEILTEGADQNASKQELIETFPEEREGILRYYEITEALYRESMSLLFKDMSLIDGMTFPLRFPHMMRYANKTVKEVMQRLFKDERIRAQLLAPAMLFLPTRMCYSSFVTFAVIATMHRKFDMNLIKGGSYKLPQAFEKSVLNHGGEIVTEQSVRRILTENKKAVGVELQSGETIHAKYVISCVDSYQTFFNFLGKENLPEKVKSKIEKMKLGPVISVIHLALDESKINKEIIPGVNVYLCSYDPEKWCTTYEEQKLTGDSCSFVIVNFGSGKTISWAKGITQIMIMSPTITPPDADLKPLKEEIIENEVSNLEKIVPNVRKAITEKDCFTSQDFEREIRLPKGCLGWSPTPDQVGRGIIPQKTFLKNLYLAGQWTSPGPGMNTCIISGMEAARLILKEEQDYMAIKTIESYRDLLLPNEEKKN